MVKIKTLINKETGKPYVSKEGKELQEFKFEAGDVFVPKYNSVIEKKKVIVENGQQKVIEEYSILVNELVDKDGNKYEDIFISLTPTQAKSIKNKLENGDEINQHIWKAYEYEKETEVNGQIVKNTFVGINYKKTFKEPIKLDENE